MWRAGAADPRRHRALDGASGRALARSGREGRAAGGGAPPPPLKQIAGLQFSLATPEWIRGMADTFVEHSSTTERQNKKGGVHDTAMGPCDRSCRCPTCTAMVNDCSGHSGYIDCRTYLPFPFTIDIFKRVIDLVCMCCGMLHLVVTPQLRAELLALPPAKRLDAAKKRCPKILFCGQAHRSAARAAEVAAPPAAGKKKKGGPLKRAHPAGESAQAGQKASPSPAPATPGATATAAARKRSTRGARRDGGGGGSGDADADDPSDASASSSEASSASDSGTGSGSDTDADAERQGAGGAASDASADEGGEEAAGTDADAPSDKDASAASETERDNSGSDPDASGSDDDDDDDEAGSDDDAGGAHRRRRPRRKSAKARGAPAAEAARAPPPSGSAAVHPGARIRVTGRVSAAAAETLNGAAGVAARRKPAGAGTGTGASAKPARAGASAKPARAGAFPKPAGGGAAPGPRGQKQFAGGFDAQSFRALGCGAPVPRYTREGGLRLQAAFVMPYDPEVGPSKGDWPAYNFWRIYETLRGLSPDTQNLLGFNADKSPVRALMTNRLHVPPRIVRYKKEKENGKGGGQDDNTQALRDVVLRTNKLRQKRQEDRVSRDDQLPSLGRSVTWACAARPAVCVCGAAAAPPSPAPARAGSPAYQRRSPSPGPGPGPSLGGRAHPTGLVPASPRGVGGGAGPGMTPASPRATPPAPLPGGAARAAARKAPCRCAAAAVQVACNEALCLDPHWCTCLPYGQLARLRDPARQAALDAAYRARDALAAAAVCGLSAGQGTTRPGAPMGGGGGGGGGGGAAGSRRLKGLRELAQEVETAITTYTIGDINKKGAGRREGKPGVSPWAGTTNNSNSIQKRDKAFSGRLVGKTGRIRGTMYGKRGERNGRTVASGDTHQNISELGVPREIATTLTVCERFQGYNRAQMMDRLRSNRLDYVQLDNGDLLNTRFVNRDAYVPPRGSICERHLETGDPIVFNRQPTLAKPSIQGGTAKILRQPANAKPRRSYAVNQSLTVGFNLDFDGDEQNAHLNTTEMTRAESTLLMSGPQQIRSQQGDGVIIVLVQNSRLALFLLTDPKTCFRRAEFEQLLAQFGAASTNPDVQRLFERALLELPAPALRHARTGEPLWSGRQLVSALLPPGVFYGDAERAAAKRSRGEPADDPVIVDSEMLSGRLRGKDVAQDEPGNLLHTMVQDVGEEETLAWMSGFQRVLNYFLMQHGSTMNTTDYAMSERHRREAAEVVEKGQRWCHEYGAGGGAYDMMRPDKGERRVLEVLDRVRSLCEQRLTQDAEFRQRYGFRRNGVLDLIHSGAKGKMPHLVQMGAMVGQQMPGRGRVTANVAHFTATMHLAEAHGFVAECYADGLQPWAFFCAAKGGREGLVHTSSSTPLVGYFQKRLGNCMSDLHAKPDGSVRDCREFIVQWLYGDDARDPSFLESSPARFLTPISEASPRLAALQRAVLQARARLYATSAFLPATFLAPTNLARLLRRAAHPSARASLASLGSPGPSGLPGPDGPAGVGAEDPLLTAEDAERWVDAWVGALERGRLLRPPTDPRYDLQLDALLRDALSPWNLVTRHRLRVSQLAFFCRELERALARSQVAAGEAVGPVASQSMGAPATQITLNQFHFAGAQNTHQSAVSRLNDTVNACKKPTSAGMTLMLRPEWQTRRELVEMVAQDIRERRLVEYVLELRPCFGGPLDEDRGWVDENLQLHPDAVRAWFAEGPCMRVEFHRALATKQRLTLVEIVALMTAFFKRGVAAVHAGQHAPRWVLYLVVEAPAPAAPAAPAAMMVLGEDEADGEAASLAQVTLLHSAVVSCLQELCVRGVPKVTDAAVTPMETRVYNPAMNAIVAAPAPEWVIVTQGSQFEAMALVPAIDFARSSTSYVHDVHKVCGIEGSRCWLRENLEDLVRGSRVDLHHPKLIADVMTRTGAVTPMTRNGLKNSTDSVCRLLFENVLENIKTAGAFAQYDHLKGVPESIMMGIPAAIGTGATKVVAAPPKPPSHPAPLGRFLGALAPRPPLDEPRRAAVRWGTRKVPCRSRPFRFFQLFVPVNRAGEWLVEPRDLAPTASAPTLQLVRARTLVTPAAPVAAPAVPSSPGAHGAHGATRAKPEAVALPALLLAALARGYPRAARWSLARQRADLPYVTTRVGAFDAPDKSGSVAATARSAPAFWLARRGVRLVACRPAAPAASLATAFWTGRCRLVRLEPIAV
jgi:DNA-directed RNA polymerase beta' subunit